MSVDDSRPPSPNAYRVKDFIGATEAARLIGVNVSTVLRWTKERRLIAIKSGGGHRRWRRSTVIAFADKYKRQSGSITDGELHKAVFSMFKAAEGRGAQTQMIHREVVTELAVSVAIVRELWAEWCTALGAPVLVNKQVQITPDVDKPTAKRRARAKADEAHDAALEELDARHAEREEVEEAAHQAHLAMLRGEK